MHANPTLTVYCGPMFSGKTTALLASVERYKLQGRRVVLLKSTIDDRYASTEVVTHSGWKHSAQSVASGDDIISTVSTHETLPDVIALDELFMVPEAASSLLWLYKCGISVVVSTLDLSSSGKAFPEVEKLLPHATTIKKFTAVCVQCGRDAAYTHKKNQHVAGSEIEVGGEETYEPRCAFHHPLIMNHEMLSVRFRECYAEVA